MCKEVNKEIVTVMEGVFCTKKIIIVYHVSMHEQTGRIVMDIFWHTHSQYSWNRQKDAKCPIQEKSCIDNQTLKLNKG